MEVDHINENTIRVRITNEELANRGLNVLDLLGEKTRVQDFFSSILEEINVDHIFGEGTPVTFQVMPNATGLDLLITKVTKANKGFTEMEDSEPQDRRKNIKSMHKRAFFDLDPESESYEQDGIESWQLEKKHVYCFRNLANVVELAAVLDDQDIFSSLYMIDNRYFLLLKIVDDSERSSDAIWAVTNEYGLQVKNIAVPNIAGLGSCIFKTDALMQVKQNFIKVKH